MIELAAWRNYLQATPQTPIGCGDRRHAGDDPCRIVADERERPGGHPERVHVVDSAFRALPEQ
jgi:hypothetical protein